MLLFLARRLENGPLLLTFNGDYFFLSFSQYDETYGLRLLPDGTGVDSPLYLGPYPIHITLADSVPPSAERTFVALFAHNDVRRIRSQSGSVVSATTIPCGRAPRGASDGEHLFGFCGNYGFFIEAPPQPAPVRRGTWALFSGRRRVVLRARGRRMAGQFVAAHAD